MPNRVIKDSIWNSPTLAILPDYIEDQWPRWLLMGDDWGCFNADPEVIKGQIYPKRKKETAGKITEIIQAYFNAGLLFIWSESDGRQWGYFPSWDCHHDFCNKTHVDGDGKQVRHKRKTPNPPDKELAEYLERFRAVRNKYRIPNPNPNPNPNPKDNAVESKKPDSPAISKPPKNPDLKPCIDYYHDAFLLKFRTKPHITGKDAKLLDPITRRYGLEKTKELLDGFFNSDDEFIQQTGYTVGAFSSCLNKLLVGNNGKVPPKSIYQKNREKIKRRSEKYGDDLTKRLA